MQVRGEAYDETKALRSKKHKENLQPLDRKKKKPKAVLYEADEIGGDANDATLHLGLGDNEASNRVKQQIRRMNMPLEKRFKIMQEEKSDVIQVKSKGGSKEITYIPLAARRKHELNSKKERGDEGAEGSSRRERRGIKELGLKSPFKRN